MARFGVASQGRDALAYVDSRLNTVPTVDSNRDPTTSDTNYPIQTIWRNQNTFRECMLVGFISGAAQWRCFTDGDGSVLELEADDGNQVQPVGGVIDVLGETVAAGILSKPVFTNGATANTLKVQIQLGTTVSPTPADNTKAGLVCVNINQFDIDATSGMISLKGDSANQAMTKLDVDFNTAPGTDPVVPSATGQISLWGNTVANGTNTSAGDPVPVATHSRAVNQTHIDVQISTTIDSDPGDPDDVGLVSAYSGDFDMTGNGFMTLKTPNPEIGAINLGMTYNVGTGVITIRGANGSDLSASNPAYITLPSNATADQLVTVKMTSNFTFEDANGTSDFAGSLFGFDTGDDTAAGGGSDIPFYIFPILDDNDANLIFATSRVPSHKKTAASSFYNAASGSADNAFDMLALTSVTVGDYDDNYTTVIGSMELQLDGSDDWVVGTVDSEHIGMGRYAENNRIFPRGVMGARSGSYFKDNGGTAPTINTGDQFPYKISRDGVVTWEFSFRLTGSPAGAVDALMITPIKGGTGTTWSIPGSFSDSSASLTRNPIAYHRQNADDDMKLWKMDGTVNNYQYADFGTDDVIRGTLVWLV